MIIAELIAELGFDLKNEADLRRFEQGMKGVETKLTAFAATVTRIGAAAGAAMGAGFVALAKSVVSTSAEFEKYETTLTTIEGSADKARAAMDWVTDFAQKTPFQVDEITRAFVKLRSYGLDPMDGSMTQMGDTAAGMGKSLDQVVEAVADAATFQFERLRELGIVASQAGNKVTFSWTENGKSLKRTIDKTSADVTKFLYEVWDKKFSGAMIRQSKTWEGMVSNISDSWDVFKLKIGRGGFFDAVKRNLADLLDYVGELSRDGTLDRWSKNLSNAFEAAVGSARRFVDGFAIIGDKIADALKKITGGKIDLSNLQALGAAALALAWKFAPWAFWLTVIYTALDDIFGYLRGDKSVFGDFVAWIEKMTGASQGLAEVLGSIAVSLGLIAALNAGKLLKALGTALGVGGAAGGAAKSAGKGAAKGAETAASSGWLAAAAGWLGAAAPFLGALITPSSAPKDQNSYLNASPEERKRMREQARKDAANYEKQHSDATPKPDRGAAYRSYLEGKNSGGDPLSNFMANWNKMSSSDTAKAVASSYTDSRNQSVTVGDINVTVQQAAEAPEAIGAMIKSEIQKSVPDYNRTSYARGNAEPIRTPARLITGN